MTAPRFIRPGRIWLVTRRTTRRTFLLRPDPDGVSQNIYWYTTAVFARKFGIQLHAVQVLSTHIHEVLTDVRGNLPAFLRERNRALANAIKRHREWPEEVFQRAPTSCVEIYGVEALCREIGYTIANCVEAGLARTPEEWPGVRTLVSDMGRRTIRVERPDVYFRPRDDTWPQHAELTVEMPDSLRAAYRPQVRKRIARAVESAVERAREIALAAGHFFLASAAALMRIPFSRTAKREEAAFGRNPTFATAGDTELTRFALEERRFFYRDYAIAKRDIGNPEKRIPFPFGTWRWVAELGCESQPEPRWFRNSRFPSSRAEERISD